MQQGEGNEFVSFDRVGFSFSTDSRQVNRPILCDVSLRIGRGEFFCLLGPSGCGKTTLLNVLGGFEKPSTGAVSIEGNPIAGPGADRMMVFQGDDSLFPWLTAIENIEFGLRMAGIAPEERRRIANDALRLVGLKGQGDKFPRQLSGGMKQRIQIARAIVCRSRILLMDEPFAALDAQIRSLMQDELVQLWQATGATVLFITHDIGESLILADRIGLMSAGPDATIREIIDVKLERPRRRDNIEFGRVYEQLNRVLSNEVRITLERAGQ
jgi:NitT/TauT family transport system ATP-binding protein